MIKIISTLDEAVNPAVLSAAVKTATQRKGLDDPKKIYEYLIQEIFKKYKNPSDKLLQAYGSSKKEFMQAIELILKYNIAKDKHDEEAASKALNSFRPLNKEGKLNDSKVLKLAKEMLENLTDSEFEQIMQALEASEDAKVFGKTPYNVLQDNPKKFFNIKDTEEDRFLKSKNANLRGLVDKQSGKRKIKKSVNKAVDKVTGAVDRATSAVKDKYNKLVNAGKYISGWLT